MYPRNCVTLHSLESLKSPIIGTDSIKKVSRGSELSTSRKGKELGAITIMVQPNTLQLDALGNVVLEDR